MDAKGGHRPGAAGRVPSLLLAGVALLCGCGDLVLEADRVPVELEVSPDSGLLTAGQPTKLKVVVRDQHGQAMTMPGWTPPTWEVSDEAVAEMGPDGTLTGTKGGTVTVTAQLAGLSAEASFRMNPDRLLLTAPAIYMTQAAQNRSNTVPLVAGRPGLLRVFVVGDQPSWGFEPAVHVKLLEGEEVVFERRIAAEGDRIPTEVDESDWQASHDVEIPGALVRPGVGLVVELDPDGDVPLAPGSRTRYPEVGSQELDVVAPPLFRQVFVPTLMVGAPDYSVYDWLEGVGPDSDQMRYTRHLLPIWDMEVEVHDTLWVDDLGTEDGWRHWINAIRVLHLQEGRRGYYYGVAGSTPSDIFGYAEFAVPWSVGLAMARIYTHEVGHNMDLAHADCGGAGGPDPNFPYGEGSSGIWGYNSETKELVDPNAHKDMMSYCDPAWVSDYHFRLATEHRLDGDGGIDLDGGSAANRRDVLVVWGSVHDGELQLDPAFVLDGPVELPRTDGPYRVEGLDAEGNSRFSLSFAPTPREHGGAGFAFLVPYEADWADDLHRMVLTGPEGADIVTRDGGPEIAVLTDPSTGTIRAIVRNWDGGPLPGEERAAVTTSRGIPPRVPR